MTLAVYMYLFFTKYKNIFLRRKNMVESRESQLHIIPGNGFDYLNQIHVLALTKIEKS